MTMPQLTGERLVKEMTLVLPDIPVVLFTGFSERISPETISEWDIQELVFKPLVRIQLASAVRNALDS